MTTRLATHRGAAVARQPVPAGAAKRYRRSADQAAAAPQRPTNRRRRPARDRPRHRCNRRWRRRRRRCCAGRLRPDRPAPEVLRKPIRATPRARRRLPDDRAQQRPARRRADSLPIGAALVHAADLTQLPLPAALLPIKKAPCARPRPAADADIDRRRGFVARPRPRDRASREIMIMSLELPGAQPVRVRCSCCFLIKYCSMAISAAPLMPTIRTPLTASSGPSSFHDLLMTMSPYPSEAKFTPE
ncbi:MAG: hypothetical protein AW07_03915 [Candidatus Accumulibacter sp. SK-11]|nr:MAG: hypothetical protein AW07_03915 [Candidatus Accumulibacter sp. SK-11]